MKAVSTMRRRHTTSLHTPTHRTTSGFTIVELLIVIVIIAILAAITIVAYSGIQQRAQNSAIISAAEQTYKLIEGYVSTNDAYPLTSTSTTLMDACITTVSGCIDSSFTFASSATLTANLKTIGSPPLSVPSVGAHGIGIRYNYDTTRTVDGKAQPVVLQYLLLGSNQQCKLPGVLAGTWTISITSTTGYYANTSLDGINKTVCVVSIPGPSA